MSARRAGASAPTRVDVEVRAGELRELLHHNNRLYFELDAPEILTRCREDAADIALLVPL